VLTTISAGDEDLEIPGSRVCLFEGDLFLEGEISKKLCMCESFDCTEKAVNAQRDAFSLALSD